MPVVYDNKKTSKMLSVSQVTQFLKCKQAWYYGYRENLTPRIERPYLTVGKLAHAGMAEAFEYQHWCQKQEGNEDVYDIALAVIMGCDKINAVFEEYLNTVYFLEEELTLLQKTCDDAKTLFRMAYQSFGPTNWAIETVDGKPTVELHFTTDLARAKGFHGFIDLIAFNIFTGERYAIDFKFRKSLSGEDEELFNLQNAVYQRVCAELGIPIVGTLTFQHLNTPPMDPNINKNGTISRVKIKTTWRHYADFCTMNGQDPKDYEEEMRPKLEEVEWYRSTTEYRPCEHLDNLWTKIIEPTAREIANPRKLIVPAMYPWNCKMCSFADLCVSDLRGYDSAFIREAQYMKKGAKLFVKEEEDLNGEQLPD